jgi:hypothetical protein
MPFCVNCGTEIPAGINFCGKCGKPVASRQSQVVRMNQTEPKTRPRTQRKPQTGYDANQPPKRNARTAQNPVGVTAVQTTGTCLGGCIAVPIVVVIVVIFVLKFACQVFSE